MRMQKVIESIEDALDKECYLPALALTLTIPDICAQIDFPSIYKKEDSYKERKGQGAAYAKWYDENIAKYETVEGDRIDFTDHIDGMACWKIRCSLLHDAKIDIDKALSKEEEKIEFRFIVTKHTRDLYMGGSSSMGYRKINGVREATHIDIDIVNFCKKIIAVFKTSYLSDEKIIDRLEKDKLNFVVKF